MVGLFDALLTTVRTPFEVTAAIGLKLTLSLQLLPTVSAAPHVPRLELNAAVDAFTDVTLSVPGPLLVIVNVLVSVVPIRRVPKSSVAAIANVGIAVTPVPVNVTRLGEPAAL